MAIRILFLSVQLQPFLVSGIKELLKQNFVEILVYCEKVKNDDLLLLPNNKNLKLYKYDNKPDAAFWAEIVLFQPTIVFCAGWMFWRYVKWCQKLKTKGIYTICAMDTQWKGTIKQRSLCFFSRLIFRKAFTHAWVPGQRQEYYALKLGFSRNRILQNLYAPDTNLFSSYFIEYQSILKKQFPKAFLYVGRLVPHKIDNLLKAFLLLNELERDGWQMILVGDVPKGDLAIASYPNVLTYNAVKQNELNQYINIAAVFCLCSQDEPWGMVVQEFAAAGMPLLVSKQCGSSDHFVKDNGLKCDGADIFSIKEGMLHIINMEQSQFLQMSQLSHQLGISSNSSTWAQMILSLA